jgi:hypothetical protein
VTRLLAPASEKRCTIADPGPCVPPLPQDTAIFLGRSSHERGRHCQSAACEQESWVAAATSSDRHFEQIGASALSQFPNIFWVFSGVIAVVGTVTTGGTFSAQSIRMDLAISIASGAPVG